MKDFQEHIFTTESIIFQCLTNKSVFYCLEIVSLLESVKFRVEFFN